MRNIWRRGAAIRNLGFVALLFCTFLHIDRAFGQATNLVVDSLQGEVDQNEIDTYISFMNNPANTNATLPTNALGDNLAFGTPGTNLEGLNYMYRIAGDLNLTTEQMQLMDLAITWSERFILLRNDQAMGPHQVMWTGNVDPVWVTYAATSSEAGYAGSENGDTAGHILFTALNILETPSIWNQTVPDGDPNHFGTTYLQRAQTYINMMEYTTQNYFTKYFINPTTYQIVPPTSAVWVAFNENMDAWNRQFLLTNDYLRLAQCHAILGDNPTLQAFYTNIVKTSADAFIANAHLVTAYGQAAYDWGYGNEGDLLGQVTGESSSHASYDMQGLARVFEAGPAYTSATQSDMQRYANTIEYVLFNFAAYNANQTTAYYKTIDAGLPPVPAGTATQDYLYPQFYFLTPYNTLFWSPAAYGAGVHNNYHNNPYMTAGILYSKHWVYNHPQDLISVASNTQTVSAGGTATYTVSTTSTTPVALSVSGLPSGDTASFDNASISSGTTATLTVTAATGSINGSSLFTLTGSNGNGTQSLGLSIVVTAPDFTIGLSSTSTVTAGNPGSFTVTITPLNGFTGNVTLSPDTPLLEPGTSVTFNPPVIAISSGTGVSSVVAATLPTTPGGEWPFGVIATSGATSHEGYSRLTVEASQQTVSFPSISNVVYGTAPIHLQAAATSNLPVAYTVTGPAILTGSPTLQGQTLTITGAGVVTVTASQAGSKYVAAATPVVQSFTVAPAVLTLAAQNTSMLYGSPVPALTANITGYVNGDTSSVVSGSPALSTTATSTSPLGTYPITVSQGTLAAANYTFTFANGVIDIYGGRR
ncbi:hypothetical protein GCM10011507_34060 [Edaphobacter acidisoli]|uniref:MBG domain-containing protein n=1 Tax=Edaphobacter acidisoli TaxID=2040573 RepID=A0A916S295_9BACT|nr:MBG domain-containing protein [Edaphobacter acidisoli]GGA79984.1 hypothetical protein GCM10011507_34060 [Edaphobacter acidisoli]